MSVPAASEVIGRESELRSLRKFAEGLGEGPAAVLLNGAAGMGKTTLWRVATETARTRGHRVLASRPSAAEARLGFANGFRPSRILSVTGTPKRPSPTFGELPPGWAKTSGPRAVDQVDERLSDDHERS